MNLREGIDGGSTLHELCVGAYLSKQRGAQRGALATSVSSLEQQRSHPLVPPRCQRRASLANGPQTEVLRTVSQKISQGPRLPMLVCGTG